MISQITWEKSIPMKTIEKYSEKSQPLSGRELKELDSLVILRMARRKRGEDISPFMLSRLRELLERDQYKSYEHLLQEIPMLIGCEPLATAEFDGIGFKYADIGKELRKLDMEQNIVLTEFSEALREARISELIKSIGIKK